MLEKILGVLLVFAALVCVWFATDPYEIGNFHFGGKLSFSEFISEDLSHMGKKNLLPKAWDSIQYVMYNLHTEQQRELLGNRKFKIKDGPAGRYYLEIEFIEVPDEENPSLILQMSLFDIASKNKVWELGKTYSIAAYLKKDKEKEKPKAQAPSSNTAPVSQPQK